MVASIAVRPVVTMMANKMGPLVERRPTAEDEVTSATIT
jgi:hypothetical protein